MPTKGHHWSSAEYVQDWIARLESRTLEKIKRTEQFNVAVDVIPFDAGDAVRVVDLGCGWGALLSVVLDRYPHATGIGLDSSPVMLSLGRERLAEYGARVSFVEGDLADPGWTSALDGEISVIVSSRAVHHLEAERKKSLYREIFQRLAPGGCFVNVDHVRLSDPSLRQIHLRVRAAEIERMARAAGLEKPTEEMLAGVGGTRSATDTHSPVTDQLVWLEEAGFRAVDIFWMYLGTAVFGGFKP